MEIYCRWVLEIECAIEKTMLCRKTTDDRLSPRKGSAEGHRSGGTLTLANS